MLEREYTEAAEAVKTTELPEGGEVAAEQLEMDAMSCAEVSQEVIAEQQEMDEFQEADAEKVGRKLIYNPDERSGFEESFGDRKVGEYRMFAYTGEYESKYKLFAKG